MATQLVAGKYRLLNKLGEGGMGAVWRALNTATEAEVALKFIAAALTGHEDIRRRFELEARIGARLNHANVVRVFDIENDPERGACLVTELLEGQDLGAYLAAEGDAAPRRRLGLEEVCDLLAPIMDALDTAHRTSIGDQVGVVHRDVKPDNIFLTHDHRGARLTKLMDFGVARVRDASAPATAVGVMVGTPGYMAPEQIRGEPDRIGPATDIYAMGVVVFECLAGQRPFEDAGEAMQEMRCAVDPSLPVPSLQRLRPDLPEAAALQPVLETAMQRHPDDRYPSMRAFAEALAAVGRFDLDALLGTRGARAQGSLAPSPPELSGQLREKYTLGPMIGEGGMGQVYRATNTWTGTDVAIKFVSSDRSTSKEVMRRFELEAKVGARLEHPNVLKVFDLQVDSEHGIGIVMELLQGQSLARYLGEVRSDDGRHRQLSLAETCRILIPVMHGLHAAHRMQIGSSVGVTHRDVKPDNIFLGRDHHGDVVAKLMDFGIARIQESTSIGTVEGQMVGTPGYMSPEQLQGHQALIGPASDIWSVGIVLYECLTGLRPYARPGPEPVGPTVEITNLLANVRWPKVSEVRPNLERATALDAVLECALAHEPAARFADMAEFIRALADAAELDLDALLGRSRLTPSQLPTSAPAVKPRTPRWVFAVAAVLLLTATGVAVALVASSPEPTPEAADARPEAAPVADDTTPIAPVQAEPHTDPEPAPGTVAQPDAAPPAAPAGDDERASPPELDLVQKLLQQADDEVREP